MTDSLSTQCESQPDDGGASAAKQASWLVRVAIFNPYLVIVLCLFIAVIGYVSLTRLPVDILPTYDTPAVQVLTLYPGMPTEFMNRLPVQQDGEGNELADSGLKLDVVADPSVFVRNAINNLLWQGGPGRRSLAWWC
ncbi:MAG: efflux RND transporter permease subunit [Planctomycetaceae bacterium]|nr:MAG: efflux RND transporter permease subunit [Planctomycetaceae bacterium]